jgi:regulator of sigma E protease
MLNFLWTFASFIVALGILVAVHEWGHFWVARRCGVKVLRFSIGFGKPLWSRTDRKGTEYVIAAIPLGGYVRMLDDRLDEIKPEEEHVTFNSQPVLSRIAIIAAGPGVNFLFAIVALYLMYLIGVQSVRPVIGNITPTSIAAQSGLSENVRISKVGDREVKDWNAINLEFVSHIGKDTMAITTYTPANMSEKEFELDISSWKFDPDKESAIRSVGIQPFRPTVTTIIDIVAKDSPAERAGIKNQDKLLSIDGTPVEKWEQIGEHLAGKANQEVGVMVLREGREVPIMVTVGAREGQPEVGYLGVVPQSEPWPEEYIFNHQYGPVAALGAAMDNTWRLMTLSVEMIGKLLTGDVSVKNLSGPISIAKGAGTSASYGLVYFLSFLALISVNLGIINLLPLPILDGGHLMYYTFELITGKPVPESIQEVGFRIGAVLLFMLMAVAITNDIARF